MILVLLAGLLVGSEREEYSYICKEFISEVIESIDHTATSEGSDYVGRIATSRLDETWTLTCTAAIAIAGGHARISEAILELEGGMAKEFLEWSQNR